MHVWSFIVSPGKVWAMACRRTRYITMYSHFRDELEMGSCMFSVSPRQVYTSRNRLWGYVLFGLLAVDEIACHGRPISPCAITKIWVMIPTGEDQLLVGPFSCRRDKSKEMIFQRFTTALLVLAMTSVQSEDPPLLCCKDTRKKRFGLTFPNTLDFALTYFWYFNYSIHCQRK